MQRLAAYLTGALALLLVVVSVVAAAIYAISNGYATISNLATSTLTGIGMSIGGLLGSFLVLRYKIARAYLKTLLQEIHSTPGTKPNSESKP
jgi:hypothetical protein